MVGQRNPHLGVAVFSVGFAVEEHHEFLRLRIEEHLGPFDHTLSRLQAAGFAAADVERDAAILPAGIIPGAVDVHPHPGAVAGAPRDLVFAVPVEQVSFL